MIRSLFLSSTLMLGTLTAGNLFAQSLEHTGIGRMSYGSPTVRYEGGESFLDTGCENCGIDDCVGTCTAEYVSPTACWCAGVEFTLLQPYFENNPAFTTLDSDGDTFENFTETQFSFEREMSPRIWIETQASNSIGLRAVYWQFDHPSATATGTPPANGFGRISPQPFGSIDLSTTVPGSQFIANSSIDAYTVDLELTKGMQWGNFGFMSALGIRIAEIEQRYLGELRDENDVQTGIMDFAHQVRGAGPTLAVRGQRPFTSQLSLFGIARGSLIFGDGQSSLTAVEDLDLDDQLTTAMFSSRDDLLPIGEMQIGLQWSPNCVGVWTPYVHAALEGQLWGGVGNASSEDGNLGFFGVNIAVGFDF